MAGIRSAICCLCGIVALVLACRSGFVGASAQESAEVADSATKTATHPLPAAERQQLRESLEQQLAALPVPNDTDANAVQVHARRGDAYFFLGRFNEAVAEYRQMVTLQPELDASHWRLGIALFFADQPQAAAEQFEKYHSFDDVDRENGIWRYLSQYKASGAENAAKELIRYDKDDREPFPAVYRIFDGSLTADDALQAIPADLPAAERDKRLFYTELYIGMHLAVQPDEANIAADTQPRQRAIGFLSSATAHQWPRRNGFGPNFMWHVARLQYELLTK